MNRKHESLDELDALLSALCDGAISDAQVHRLEQLVSADKGLCQYYIRYMQIQASLSRYVRTELDDGFSDGSDAPSVRSSARQATQSSARTKSTRRLMLEKPVAVRGRWPSQRLSRYAVAACLLLACFIVLEGLSRKSVSAKAFDVALQQFSTARVIEYLAEFKWDGKIVRVSESMHLQPDRVREELPDGKIKVIDFSKRRNITLDPRSQTAVVVIDTSPPQNYKPERFLDKVKEYIQRIKTDPLRTDRYLGKRDLDGRTVEGFQMQKLTQVQTLWVDIVTGLPSEMEIVSLDNPGQSVVMRNFRFDVQSHESLFSVDPPPGYKVTFETAEPARPLDEKAKMIPR